ncbi:transposase [Pseudomonas sp. REB1044]|uniref:IS66-like element accessory protein TnpA n=1 Tax=Pseudomonas sp. REB1044 TaxID=2675224 RepID=UPI00315DC0B1
MRQRTSYPKPFKAQVVQECLQPDVSIASIALRHGINVDLVRKWIPLYRDRQPDALPAFLPLTMKSESEPLEATLARIEIPFKQQTLTVTWPTVDPDGCARFIRSLVK